VLITSVTVAVKQVSYDYSVLNEVTVRKKVKLNTDKSDKGEKGFKGCGRPLWTKQHRPKSPVSPGRASSR